MSAKNTIATIIALISISATVYAAQKKHSGQDVYAQSTIQNHRLPATSRRLTNPQNYNAPDICHSPDVNCNAKDLTN